jgi:hypothetical protein
VRARIIKNRDQESRRGAGGAISEARTERALAFFQPAGDYFRREVMLGYRQGTAQFGVREQNQHLPGPLLHSAKFRTEFGNHLLVVQHITHEHEGKRGSS